MNEMVTLCQRYGAHADAAAFLGEAYEKLQANEGAFAVFMQQVRIYEENYLFEHKPVLAVLHGLEEITGISWTAIDMMYMLILLPLLEELYEKEGIEKERFWDFVSHLQPSWGPGKDSYGFRAAWWFMDFYKLKLFSVGRLQYRRRSFKCDTVCADQVFPEGSYCLDVHIPGARPLLKEECEQSYKTAAAFYKKRFGDSETVFSCYSWLLSPDLDVLLPEHSNILAFAHRFTLAETVPDENFSHVEFAFGVHEKPVDLRALPERSSLQRALKAWLLEGNILRLGKGYFRYDE